MTWFAYIVIGLNEEIGKHWGICAPKHLEWVVYGYWPEVHINIIQLVRAGRGPG